MLRSPVQAETETMEPRACAGVPLPLALGLGMELVVPPVVPVVGVSPLPVVMDEGSRFSGADAAMVLKLSRDLDALAEVLEFFEC